MFPPSIGKVSAATPHPAGTLINISGTIWKISDDGKERFSIDSEEKFYSHRYNFINVVPANASDKNIPSGGNLEWGDGVLFTDNKIIYQISGGTKHGFTSADVFLAQGFSFDSARQGNLSKLKEGTPVRSGSERHLPGTLLTDNNGTIWLQKDKSASPFPSAAVFFSHGGSFDDVVKMNSADSTMAGSSTSAHANYRVGALVNDAGTVYAISDAAKMAFPSSACFLGFDFNFGMVLSGSTKNLTAKGTVCGDSPTLSNPSGAGPAAGAPKTYTEQSVNTAAGSFVARIATFELSSGKFQVITDVAADRDCADDCTVANLQAYASAAAADAGINGTYFCPAEYAGCGSETNAFFWKIIDTKLGVMINKDNGLGEQDPFLAFDSTGRATYFSKWAEYNKSNFSAVAGINSFSLIENNNISLDYSKMDAKQGLTKASRGAIGIKGQTLYLVHVLAATVTDSAYVMQSLGMDHALGLDGGGTSAMIYDNAYKSGPGRNMPNALLIKTLP